MDVFCCRTADNLDSSVADTSGKGADSIAGHCLPSPTSTDGGQETDCPSSTDISETPSASVINKKRSHKPSDLLHTIGGEIKNLKEAMLQPTQSKYHCYAMSIALKMEELTDYQAAVAKRDIELVLFNAKYMPSQPAHQPGDSDGVTYLSTS